MSLFDLQDVCIAIGSIATLDLPMVVDLIGIYGLKGSHCTLTPTNWFFQALSVIPRGSWGDVARRFTMILAMSLFDLQDVCIAIGSIATLDLPMVVDLIGIYGLKGSHFDRSDLIGDRSYDEVAAMDIVIGPGPVGPIPPPLSSLKPPPPPSPCAAAAAARLRRKIVSGQFDEENPFVLISSVLLVQADEGVSFLVVDRIGDYYRNLPRRADVIVTTVGARNKCQQGSGFEPPIFDDVMLYVGIEVADVSFAAGSLACIVLCFGSWRQQRLRGFQQESAIGFRNGNPGFTAGRGFNPAGGAPGGG
ncbi:E set domain-containing protein [Dorcoceras hygrometricum]|uniref:E set domain-containing protein n=1 Tax=Dorcoceras hygrometricum TaxID=472368 RepID=A0A2Z7BLG4_9LAMI|nr:E set domain-containing protein [Dorcoceras hygrometricum]